MGLRKAEKKITKIQTDIALTLHNRFDVEVIDVRTGEVRQRAQALNVVCDKLWTELFNSLGTVGGVYFWYIHYGTGTGTPSAADTTLFAKRNAISIGTPSFTMHSSREYAYSQANISIAPETDVGQTLTEVGIGKDANYVCTHAMLQDMNGNPISILKTATDLIKIYATIYVHWSVQGWENGSILPMLGVSKTSSSSSTVIPLTDFVKALAGAYGRENSNIYSHRPGFMIGYGIGAQPGTYAFTRSSPYCEYNATTRTLTYQRRLAVDEGNIPIRALVWYLNQGTTGAAFALFAHTWYTPSQITGESVGTGTGSQTEFSTKFPIRSGLTVYVDGVATPVTMRQGDTHGSRCARYMHSIDVASTLSKILYAPNGGDRSSDQYYCFAVENAEYPLYLENPFYNVGISGIRHRRVWNQGTTYQVRIDGSDDLNNWTEIATVSGSSTSWASTSVGSGFQNFRFMRLVYLSGDTRYPGSYIDFISAEIPGGNIRFATAPASGAVITADYTPDCIAKDSNHVFDFTINITLAPY